MSNTLKYNSSKILFGDLGLSGFNELLEKQFLESKKIIITDENVAELWLANLIGNFDSLKEAEIIELPAGEENKVLEICTHVWKALSEYEISRNDLIINFGGGVITDMGGFIASTFKRGLNFINIPTTLLSQVDASVGGKTGIDLGPYKNQIGVFSDPSHVYIDDKFLSTLDDEQLLSGFSEMLKHGLINDADYWSKLKDINPLEIKEFLPLIQESVKLKKEIVEQDPKEAGLRKILNFGHTIGHGIEGFLLSSKKTVPHGFAVAWGMKAESYIACQLEMISQASFEEIESSIDKIYPQANFQESSIKQIIDLMQNDKKNAEGKIKFCLINGIGEAVYNIQVEGDLIHKALKHLII